MNSSGDLWPRVHALLDAGRDPLADVEIQTWLLHDREALATVVALRAQLVALPLRRRVARIAAAAAVFLVAGTWGFARSCGDAGDRSPAVAAVAPLPLPGIAAGDFVRAFTASVELRGDAASLTVTRVDGAWVSERITRFVTASASGAATCEICCLDTNLR